MRAEVPVYGFDACNAIFKGTLSSPGQMCAGSTSQNGELVPDACQGDSGGPLVAEGGGEDGEGGGDDDVVVGVVSFGESCGIFPGVYTQVAAYRRWISDTILDTAAEAGLSPEDVEQILPAALAPPEARSAAEAGADGQEQEQEQQREVVVVVVEQADGSSSSSQPQLRPAVVDADGARASLAEARARRQEMAGGAAAGQNAASSSSLTTISVPAVSPASSAADLTKALASMILLSGNNDPCACLADDSAAGAGGCRPLLGPVEARRDYGCYVRGGAACALATEVGGGLHARGCRPTPAELWTARAASAAAAVPKSAPVSAVVGQMLRRAPAAAQRESSCRAGDLACALPAAVGARLRGAIAAGRGGGPPAPPPPLVDLSKVVRPGGVVLGGGGNNSLPRVLAASFRVGLNEGLRKAAAPLDAPVRGGGGGGGAGRGRRRK
jgi:hypothetical protein